MQLLAAGGQDESHCRDALQLEQSFTGHDFIHPFPGSWSSVWMWCWTWVIISVKDASPVSLGSYLGWRCGGFSATNLMVRISTFLWLLYIIADESQVLYEKKLTVLPFFGHFQLHWQFWLLYYKIRNCRDYTSNHSNSILKVFQVRGSSSPTFQQRSMWRWSTKTSNYHSFERLSTHLSSTSILNFYCNGIINLHY